MISRFSSFESLAFAGSGAYFKLKFERGAGWLQLGDLVFIHSFLEHSPLAQTVFAFRNKSASGLEPAEMPLFSCRIS